MAGAGLLVLSPWASAQQGAQTYAARCGACHSIDTDRIGPRHQGLIGRRAGSVPGFDYSPALRSSTVVWNANTLERWLADPEAFIAGQRMNFRIEDAAIRADIIAYLLSLPRAQR